MDGLRIYSETSGTVIRLMLITRYPITNVRFQSLPQFSALFLQKDYENIINLYKENITHNYYHIRKTMLKGYSNRESLRLLPEVVKRRGQMLTNKLLHLISEIHLRDHFLMSPAMVNAWYQPERNSITFPYAFWNPPYYKLVGRAPICALP